MKKANKIKNSFLLATKGKESIKNLIIWFICFLPIYFILQKYLSNIIIISTIVKAFILSFLLWHIFAIFRCKPKKIKSKISVKDASKSFMDKVLLKKPWLDLKTTTFLILLDILLILNLY
jgi:hypothetical protein